MRDPYFWTLIALFWIFGWAVVWLIRRRAQESRLLELRKLFHQERMAAIEKGVPLPEIPADEEATPLGFAPKPSN